jgi:hypothetical protein
MDLITVEFRYLGMVCSHSGPDGIDKMTIAQGGRTPKDEEVSRGVVLGCGFGLGVGAND